MAHLDLANHRIIGECGALKVAEDDEVTVAMIHIDCQVCAWRVVRRGDGCWGVGFIVAVMRRGNGAA